MGIFGSSRKDKGAKHMAQGSSSATEVPEHSGAAGSRVGSAHSEVESGEQQTGPFDADHVDYRDWDFSDFSKGGLDLGSMLIPVPHNCEVQVEMGTSGPQMVHILTPVGRLTPVAFAAPRTGSLWEETMPEVIQGMTKDGLTVSQETGPWGEELSAVHGEGALRMIVADGERWMFRLTAAGPKDKAEELTHIAREVVARSFIRRGTDPLPAGTALPVSIPQAMAEELRKQIEQRNLQAAQNAVQQGQQHNDKEAHGH